LHFRVFEKYFKIALQVNFKLNPVNDTLDLMKTFEFGFENSNSDLKFTV